MQTSKIHQGREISKDELLEIAPFTRRQLTRIYLEGYLPRPQRRSRPGSNTPVYYWDESVIEQAKLLYDLLRWSRADHWVRLPLWLQGHLVDFVPIRQRWLDSIDAYLQAFTQSNGEDDDPADEPEDHVSRVIELMKDRWKYTPTLRRPEPLRRLSLEAYAQWSELFWDMLLVADYELDETTFVTMHSVLQEMNATQNDTSLQEEFMVNPLSWLLTLRNTLTIPRLREVIEQATPEAWERARRDYMTLYQFFQTVFAPFIQEDPEGMYLLLFASGGFHLVPVALAIRQQGYGSWIDDAFAWVSKRLADPETQAMLAQVADPEVQAQLASREGREQFIEQFSRWNSETNT